MDDMVNILIIKCILVTMHTRNEIDTGIINTKENFWYDILSVNTS